MTSQHNRSLTARVKAQSLNTGCVHSYVDWECVFVLLSLNKTCFIRKKKTSPSGLMWNQSDGVDALWSTGLCEYIRQQMLGTFLLDTVIQHITIFKKSFVTFRKTDDVKIQGTDSLRLLNASLGGTLRVRGCLNHAEQWGMPQSCSPLMATAVRTGDTTGEAVWKTLGPTV